ncbi:MAG: Mth938-like domain-containing protein [Mariprofundales bacterium]
MEGQTTLRRESNTLAFRAYDDLSFTIADTHYTTSILMHAGIISTPWAASFAALAINDFATILADIKDNTANKPEVILIGTGRRTRFPAELMQSLQDVGLVCEWMDSRSCARTYNILLAEGRQVSAALLLPSA